MNDPQWATFTKKTKNKWKRQRLEEARKEVEEYEARHNLAPGGLLGGEEDEPSDFVDLGTSLGSTQSV